VGRPFPSWNRPILTEIYLCHACSYHEIEDENGRAGMEVSLGPGKPLGSWLRALGEQAASDGASMYVAWLNQRHVYPAEPCLTTSADFWHVRSRGGGLHPAGLNAGGGGSGESFLRVHWVAVPEALRARRVNRSPQRRCAP
jgi:hypothetical protein